MNDINPYTQPAETASSEEAKRKTRVFAFEIVHNVFRGLFVFLTIGIVPVFIVPELRKLFEEFGIDLPVVTTLVIQFGDWMSRTRFLTLPLLLGALATIEFGIFSIPRGKWKILANVAYWLVLILVIGLAFLGLMASLSVISQGLSASINLPPLLFRA